MPEVGPGPFSIDSTPTRLNQVSDVSTIDCLGCLQYLNLAEDFTVSDINRTWEKEQAVVYKLKDTMLIKEQSRLG